MKNIYIGLTNANDTADMVTRETEFDGIVLYLWVKLDHERICRVNEYVMNQLMYNDDVPEEVIWDMALRNTFKETRITPMSTFIPMAFGSEIMVVTNNDAFRGAACILDKEALKANVKPGVYIAIPSSVHEFLLVPKDKYDFGLNAVINMVMKVNETEVRPEDRLANTAYEIQI